MANLVYGAIASLDGYIEDTNGNFDWAEPDEEVHAFVNDRARPLGTYLYGRRMYETMAAWETMDTPDHTPYSRDFARIWQAAEKIVYSTSLGERSTARTRIERSFDPDAIGRLKATAERDIEISGPTLAAHAMRAGLVDEFQLYVAPVIVGGGKPALPGDVHIALELVEERRFDSGMVFLHYRARS
jgi:dihydrofolate reductase